MFFGPSRAPSLMPMTKSQFGQPFISLHVPPVRLFVCVFVLLALCCVIFWAKWALAVGQKGAWHGGQVAAVPNWLLGPPAENVEPAK